jgi:glycerol-3-phosphate acyltransferase PlsY
MKHSEIGLALLIFLCSYVVGSIPVGYCIARIFGISDIREHGSGNIGATNIARTLGAVYFIPVFLLDFCKAYFTVQFVSCMYGNPFLFYTAALGYLIGNGYSLFLDFTGGKGVAATAGILVCYDPALFFITLTGWVLGYAVTRTVGISSVIAACVAPVTTFLLDSPWHGVLFVTSVGIWILIRHYENVKNYCSL